MIHPSEDVYNKSRAIAGRTARCRCTFRYARASNFATASRGFFARARLSCIILHQRPFRWWNYTQ